MDGPAKALATTGSSALATMFFGALTTKIIAFLAGPVGIGTYSQLRQLGQWFTVLAIMNGQGALVRGIAAREGEDRLRFVMVVATSYLVGAIIVAGVVFALAPLLCKLLFAREDSTLIFAVRALSGVVVVGAFASFVNGVINGYRAIGTLARVQIAGAAITAVLAYPLVLWGYPIAYVVLVGSGFLAISAFGVCCIARYRWLKGLNAISAWKPDLSLLRDHASYASTVLLVGLIGTGSVLTMRSLYIRQGGVELGGLFDAAWTLSMMYVMVLLSSFGTYYIPTLSATREPAEIQKHVAQAFWLSTTIGALLISLAVASKPLLIAVLYSNTFLPSLEILRWMLIGDYLKISGWVFGMLLLAFAERKTFAISEITWQAFMVGSVTLWVSMIWEVVGIAFIIANTFYLIYVWRHAASKYGVFIERQLVHLWGLGLGMVLLLSVVTWSDSSSNIAFPLFLWAGMASVFCMRATTRIERQKVLAWVLDRIRWSC